MAKFFALAESTCDDPVLFRQFDGEALEIGETIHLPFSLGGLGSASGVYLEVHGQESIMSKDGRAVHHCYYVHLITLVRIRCRDLYSIIHSLHEGRGLRGLVKVKKSALEYSLGARCLNQERQKLLKFLLREGGLETICFSLRTGSGNLRSTKRRQSGAFFISLIDQELVVLRVTFRCHFARR